jgi:phage terminase large subunit GpA-like protein
MEKMDTILGHPKTVDITQDGVKTGTIKLWTVGVSVLKQEIYGYLRQGVTEDGGIPSGYCHFPHYDVEYFKGLTAEQHVLRINKRGYREYEWIKKYKRNEPLDCRNYARAAACLLQYDRWDDNRIEAIIVQNLENSKIITKKPVVKKKSDFWGDR